jgi:hypothetical protein
MKKKKIFRAPNGFYRDGGIHIDAKNEGKFTAFAQWMGMDVQEAARHVLAHQEQFSPVRMQQANFARNAAGWKRQWGGGVNGESSIVNRESSMGNRDLGFGIGNWGAAAGEREGVRGLPMFLHGGYDVPFFISSGMAERMRPCVDCGAGLPKAQGGGSIVDYLSSQGENASYGNRKNLFRQYFGEGYRGTAAQNLQLLKLFQSGNDRHPDQPQKRISNQTKITRSEVSSGAPITSQNVPIKDGYVNLLDYGINLYNKDGTYSPAAIQFAEEVQAAHPHTKVKFVCNEKGCFAIANRMSEGDTGKRLYGVGAWQTDGNDIWQAPALEQYEVGSGEPLPDPTDYSIPDAIKSIPRGLYVGMNRKNNSVRGRAATTKEADDSYDYANNSLYPQSHGYEHMGYSLGNGRLLHGTGAGENHPGYFVIDDLNDNEISLAGYGKYAPVEVLSTNPDAKNLKPLFVAPKIKKGNSVQYRLKENDEDNAKQRKEKKKLVDYFNNTDLDRQLMATTGISYEDLQGLKPVAMGVFGNESSFNDLSTGRKIREFFGNMGDHPSVGPFQIKLDSIPENVRKKFGISSKDDLDDLEKAYPAALAILYNNLKNTDRAVAEGIQPGLKNMDRYFRAAYDYNMPMITQGGDKRIEELWMEKTGGRGTKEEKQKFFEKMRLKGDMGSYPYKAMENAYGLEPVLVTTPPQQANVVTTGRIARNSTNRSVPPPSKELWGWPALYQDGGISTEGYKAFSPDRFHSFNIIPSNNITMKKVPHPVLGIDDTGATQMMYPGYNYRFPGQAVFELPMRGFGGTSNYQDGGPLKRFQPGGIYDERNALPTFFNSEHIAPFDTNPFFGAMRPLATPVMGTPPSAEDLLAERAKQLKMDFPAARFPIVDPQKLKDTGAPGAQYSNLPPLTLPGPKPQKKWGPNVKAATFLTGALSFLGNAFGAKDRNRYRDEVALRGLADSSGTLLPGNVEDLRGDYSVNEGYFRPQRYVPVQFGAIPTAQLGGGFGGYYNDPVKDVLSIGPSPFSYALTETPFRPIVTDSKSAATPPAVTDDKNTMTTSDLPEPDLSKKPNEAAQYAFDFYVKQKELDPIIAAGIVGNLYQESRLKPHVTNSIGAFGVAQWLGGRKTGWFNYADKHGLDRNSLDGQLNYVLTEPGESKKVLTAMEKARSAGEAAKIFADKYERMGKHEANYPVRMGVAENLFRLHQERTVPRSQEGGTVIPGYDRLQPPGLTRFNALAQYPSSSSFQEGGEYTLTPAQLKFILAHGGEVEFL